ncbi:DUF2993 domain-containing protein [uncultured Corynebacterium sp.]|uniref:LmeA family phospholipid-binding protein n=1 Tax=uncultured Corynebacterium sp. TaxID=159447 RepID=UPI0025D4CF2F|nr:DUF2993 domain-containing protein [uncultured Corynebacterium sp.]
MTRTAERTPHRRPLRVLTVVVVTVLALAGAAVVADSLVAAKVEREISQRIWHDSQLASPPAVQVGGMPVSASLWSHELSSVSVEAQDVEVPGFARVSVTSSAQKITLTRDEILSGDFEDAPARKVFTRLQLDPVALGGLMTGGSDGGDGFSDLNIQGVEDISPSGGWETEAYFTATPRDVSGIDTEVAVEMRLRVWEGDVRLLPTRIISVGGDTSRGDGGKHAVDATTRDRIMAAFTLELPGTTLPLRSKPGRVYVNGGALYIESEQNFTRVGISDLAPRSAPLGEDERAGL